MAKVFTEQEQVRLDKANELRAAGINPYNNGYAPEVKASDIRRDYEEFTKEELDEKQGQNEENKNKRRKKKTKEVKEWEQKHEEEEEEKKRKMNKTKNLKRKRKKIIRTYKEAEKKVKDWE